MEITIEQAAKLVAMDYQKFEDLFIKTDRINSHNHFIKLKDLIELYETQNSTIESFDYQQATDLAIARYLELSDESCKVNLERRFHKNELITPQSIAGSYFASVLKFMMQTKKCSISAIQNEFGLGYNQAAIIVNSMVKSGLILRDEQGSLSLMINQPK